MKEEYCFGAEKIICDCLGVNEGEEVLIVADYPNLPIGLALAEVSSGLGAETSLAVMNQREAHAQNPPDCIRAAMKTADAAALCTVFSLSNSTARIEAVEAGCRVLSLPGCCEKTIMGGAIESDFVALAPLVRLIGKILTNGKLVRVTSEAGTDLEIKLSGRKSVDQTCMAVEPGTWAPFPNCEAAVGPAENGVNGVMVIDGAVVPGGPPVNPIRAVFKDGFLTELSGGEDAEKLESFLKQYNNPDMYQVVELGIGLNEKAVIGRGLMAEDESQFGTMHLGIGAGATFGLPNSAPSHVDLVIRKPTIEVDGQLIMKNENLNLKI